MGSLHSHKLLDHFRNPRNAGELPLPAVTVQVENPACGDILRLSALVKDGRIAAAAFKVRGCTASIAAGSALTTLMTGRPAAELTLITAEALEAELGGLPHSSKHAAGLCLQALHALAKALE